ncbi:MAG: hypothetical protein NT154_45410 [Verrucomicrobia bacterium]|nr:hypothetical protein [Verrucomicrobiota bacterium]
MLCSTFGALCGQLGYVEPRPPLARLTGDRSRDLDEDVRARVVDALKRASAPKRWLRTVTDVVELEAAEEAQALGDTLPMGLRLH